jgi:hypothetical protein
VRLGPSQPGRIAVRISPVCAGTEARFLADRWERPLAACDRFVREPIRHPGCEPLACRPFPCCDPLFRCWDPLRCCGPFCRCCCEPFGCCGPFAFCGPFPWCGPIDCCERFPHKTCPERSIESILLAQAQAGVLSRMLQFDWQVVHGHHVSAGAGLGAFLDVTI